MEKTGVGKSGGKRLGEKRPVGKDRGGEERPSTVYTDAGAGKQLSEHEQNRYPKRFDVSLIKLLNFIHKAKMKERKYQNKLKEEVTSVITYIT